MAYTASKLIEDAQFKNLGGISMIKKAMLSQPMAGKTDEEIVATREKAIAALKEKGYEIVNTLFTDEWYNDKSMTERGVVNRPLCFLAKSLTNMSRFVECLRTLGPVGLADVEAILDQLK